MVSVHSMDQSNSITNIPHSTTAHQVISSIIALFCLRTDSFSLATISKISKRRWSRDDSGRRKSSNRTSSSEVISPMIRHQPGAPLPPPLLCLSNEQIPLSSMRESNETEIISVFSCKDERKCCFVLSQSIIFFHLIQVIIRLETSNALIWQNNYKRINLTENWISESETECFMKWEIIRAKFSFTNENDEVYSWKVERESITSFITFLLFRWTSERMRSHSHFISSRPDGDQSMKWHCFSSTIVGQHLPDQIFDRRKRSSWFRYISSERVEDLRICDQPLRMISDEFISQRMEWEGFGLGIIRIFHR